VGHEIGDIYGGLFPPLNNNNNNILWYSLNSQLRVI